MSEKDPLSQEGGHRNTKTQAPDSHPIFFPVGSQQQINVGELQCGAQKLTELLWIQIPPLSLGAPVSVSVKQET